jgi:hypothetical protein
MKQVLIVIMIGTLLSCGSNADRTKSNQLSSQVTGTWKLISGTLIRNGVTTVTDYTKNVSFIKIINNTHFAFLQHDLNKGKDSLAVFVAGGGSYSLADTIYTEHLEYCSDRVWEGNDFSFVITVKNDTLTQTGIEKVKEAGVDQVNKEVYVRMNR